MAERLNMSNKKFPINDYPLTTPFNIYTKGFDILAEKLKHTESYKSVEVGTDIFEEFLFWRKSFVIWTCCTIESFVNLEGVSWLGEEFYKSTVERQDIVQKIRLIVAVKCNKLIEPGNKVLKSVRRLFDLRNQFVHPKTRRIKEKSDKNFEALRNIKPATFKSLIRKVNNLLKIDSE
jgi:hypothetical protein